MKDGEGDEDTTLLQEIHHDKVMEFLPVIISLTISAILGIVGNSFTIRFYSAQRRRSSTSIFIQCLGVVDLFVCVLLFASIANLAVNVYFTVGILCKLLSFFIHSSILASVLILWIISIDRYLKVCRPLGKQFSTRWAVPVVVLVMIFSIAMSISGFLVYDSVPMPIKLNTQIYSRTLKIEDANNGTKINSTLNVNPVIIHGQYCTSTENTEFQFVVKIFNIMDVIIIVATLFTFITAYGNIIHTLLKSSKRHTRCIDEKKQDQLAGSYANTCSSPKSKLKKECTLSRMSQSMPDILASSQKEIKRNKYVNNYSVGRNKNSRSTDRNTDIYINKRKGKFTDANVTVMMATVSLAFLLSFIPYFIIAGIRTLATTSENELSALHQLALRSPFLNSIINPIIFCIFNPRYRRCLTKGFAVTDDTENFTSLKHQGQTQNRFDSSSRL